MSYPAKAGCLNCSHKWNVDIPKGTTREQWKEKAVCPNCETTGQIWASTG